jgi:endogenous inhibitor of DNA gyrase (YacG/DUF329 family)
MVANGIEYVCPTCKKRVHVAVREALPTRPFCCERCKMIDLSKWFNEEYRISSPLQADASEDRLDETDEQA